MDFTITSKTPIFTGGVNPRSGTDTIRETGIMGNLRWWYEALLRGMGRNACDPTTGNRECQCDACRVFGSTSGARKFSLVIEEGQLDDTPQIDVKIGGGAGWRLLKGKMGCLQLSINGMRGNRSLERYLAVLLQLMSNWGGIGAKNYIGYGVFDLNIRQQDPITDTDVGNLLNFIRNENPHGTGIPEPSLTQMFFSKITLDLSNTHLTIHLPGIGPNDLRKCLNFNPLFLPTAAHIRCYLRSAFRDRKQLFLCLSGVDEDLLKDLRHYTVGVLSMKDRQGKRRGNQGAKIATSHLYPIDQQSGLWQMRVWGYIPTDALPRDNRGRVLVTEAQIIADLQQRLSDPIFWQHCFDDQRIGLSRVDFRRRSAGTSFDDFLQDLVTNP